MKTTYNLISIRDVLPPRIPAKGHILHHAEPVHLDLVG